MVSHVSVIELHHDKVCESTLDDSFQGKSLCCHSLWRRNVYFQPWPTAHKRWLCFLTPSTLQHVRIIPGLTFAIRAKSVSFEPHLSKLEHTYQYTVVSSQIFLVPTKSREINIEMLSSNCKFYIWGSFHRDQKSFKLCKTLKDYGMSYEVMIINFSHFSTRYFRRHS
jgi:hypothetical protein